MIVAQISDLHVKPKGRLAYEVVDTAAYLSRAIERINGCDPQPDVVLATGDLVDGGTLEEYLHLRELLAPLRAPIYLLMGNHDERGALRAAFPDHGYLGADGPVQFTIETPVRILALDSTRPGEEGGEIDEARRAWLDERLREDSRPTLVALHHPPFLSGIVRMDAKGFIGHGALAQTIARHSHVERVISGHLHRTMWIRYAGTIATVCSSTAHQLSLSLGDSQLGFVMEPPAMQLHRWDGKRLISDVIPIDAGGGWHPFHREAKLID